jgi:hypothetical protein
MNNNTMVESRNSTITKEALLTAVKKEKERRKKLQITSDVYTAMDGAPYETPYKALEDLMDNCLTGLNDNRLSSDNPRRIILDFYCGDSSVPDNIRCSDNGIGMDEDIINNKLYVTQKVSALEKALKGGTGRWGLGYKQFTNYLGEAGDVVSREVGLSEDALGIRSRVVYEDGELPAVTSTDISKERFMQEVNGFEHGTRIDIDNIKKEKWTSSWWSPKGLTWYKSTQIRYNRLLREGKLVIVFKKHTGKGVDTKVLSPGEFVLDNGSVDDTAFTDYHNCTRNSWEFKGVDLDIDKLDISVNMNMGKHLGAIWKKEWNTLGSLDLIAGSASKASNPGIYFYQNDILLATYKYKGSDRDGGLSHLNNLFVEIDIPNDIVVPTNSTKSDIDDAWKKEVAKQVKIEAEKKWIPQDVNELAYHQAFQKKVLNRMDGMGIRHEMFEGVSETELKETLYHEFAKGSSRPDFKWEDGDKLRAIIEFKDEQANDSAVKQMAKYVMDTKFEADYYYLVAPSFNDSVKNTFKSWNKDYPQTKFLMISFDEIALKID